ncbi:hypothetical protein Tco_0574354 [Tanacetum coccineum]
MTILLNDLEGSRIQCTLSNDYMHELMSLIGTDTHCPKILIIQFGTVFKIDGTMKARHLKAATRVMVAPIISIPTYSSKESDGDTIKIGVDIVHPRPDTLTVFPVSTIVVKLAQHEEELRVQRDRQRLPRQRGLLYVLGLGRGRPLRLVFITQ